MAASVGSTVLLVLTVVSWVLAEVVQTALESVNSVVDRQLEQSQLSGVADFAQDWLVGARPGRFQVALIAVAIGGCASIIVARSRRPAYLPQVIWAGSAIAALVPAAIFTPLLLAWLPGGGLLLAAAAMGVMNERNVHLSDAVEYRKSLTTASMPTLRAGASSRVREARSVLAKRLDPPAADQSAQPVAQVDLSTEQAPPDWYPDPYARARLRYWNGSEWTPHVAE